MMSKRIFFSNDFGATGFLFHFLIKYKVKHGKQKEKESEYSDSLIHRSIFKATLPFSRIARVGEEIRQRSRSRTLYACYATFVKNEFQTDF
jgi:hypothetical protein